MSTLVVTYFVLCNTVFKRKFEFVHKLNFIHLLFKNIWIIDNQRTREDLSVVLCTIIYGSTFVSSLSTSEPASGCTSLVLSGHCWRRYPPPLLATPVSRSLVWFSSVGSLENCHRVEQFLWQLYHMTHTLIEKHIS